MALLGAGISSVVRTPDSWLKGCRFNPSKSSWRIFFSRVNFLCWLLFQYPVHPCVTAVTRKWSWSFCQKCRWQVTAKHVYNLRMWLCMMWHGALLYDVHRTCAEMAAVWCGTTSVETEKKKRYIKLVAHVESHASAVSLLKRAENSVI